MRICLPLPQEQRRDRDDRPDRSFKTTDRRTAGIGVIRKTDDLPRDDHAAYPVKVSEYHGVQGDIVRPLPTGSWTRSTKHGKIRMFQGSHLH